MEAEIARNNPAPLSPRASGCAAVGGSYGRNERANLVNFDHSIWIAEGTSDDCWPSKDEATFPCNNQHEQGQDKTETGDETARREREAEGGSLGSEPRRRKHMRWGEKEQHVMVGEVPEQGMDLLGAEFVARLCVRTPQDPSRPRIDARRRSRRASTAAPSWRSRHSSCHAIARRPSSRAALMATAALLKCWRRRRATSDSASVNQRAYFDGKDGRDGLTTPPSPPRRSRRRGKELAGTPINSAETNRSTLNKEGSSGRGRHRGSN
jgi:hypothetical protein